MRAKKIAVIGVPSSAGARRVGQERAPASLRNAGLVAQLRSNGHEVIDLGDLCEVRYSPDPQNPRQQNVDKILAVLRDVTAATDLAIEKECFPLLIGGDCTISIGILASLSRHFLSVGMMYADGDVDLNTPETTPSGIFDGMVIAHLLGWGAEEISRFGSRFPLLAERNLTLFGFNAASGSIDQAEIERLRMIRSAQYPLERIRGNVEASAQQAIGELEERARHILVHFDVDMVAFDDLPAADVPHRHGVSLREAVEALKVFVRSPQSAGFVVTEFNQTYDADGTLADRLVHALGDVFRCDVL